MPVDTEAELLMTRGGKNTAVCLPYSERLRRGKGTLKHCQARRLRAAQLACHTGVSANSCDIQGY